VVYICAIPGESSRPASANFWPHSILATSVQSCSPVVSGVVAARGQRRLDGLGAVLDERADGVADDRRALEEAGQRRHVVSDLDHLVVGGLDAGDLVDDGLDLLAVAARGDERDVELAQVLTDQAAGVAGDAIDDDRLLRRC